MRLQKELLTSYENILFQEETLWYQKSREQWIKLGSRNTAFFHAQSIIRRKRNKIHGIRLTSGEWCTDPEIMKIEALNYFKGLFCSVQTVTGAPHDDSIATLDEVAITELSNPVTKKEVFYALMSMKSYKAPDDVLHFTKATVSQGRAVKDVLDQFCSMSGLKVSHNKSKFCTSTGVSRHLRDNIAATTGIQATDRFEKYLGFKMLQGTARKQDFTEVYDRIVSKLASWKSRLLNKPGRVVLANAVISSLPAYHMQTQWLPQGMCDDLDKIVRRFIWKGTGDTDDPPPQLTNALRADAWGVAFVRE
ncbi:hypothetical protein QL285_014891 [Trifolium repens]|nr:hypothetical protein QL285_014891 [Trifolium repens]